MKLSTRIIMLIVLSVLVIGLGLTITTIIYQDKNARAFLESYEKAAYASRMDELRNEAAIIMGGLNAVYERGKAVGLNDAEIQREMKETFRKTRFFKDHSGYVFIYDFEGVVVMYPLKPEQEGMNKIGVQDSNGKFLIRELIDAAKAGGGIVKYYFPKSSNGKPLPKISYADAFMPYGWMVGLGVYVDNIEEELALIRTEIDRRTVEMLVGFALLAIVLITVIIIVALILVRAKVVQPLVRLIERATDLASGEGDLRQQLEVRGHDELAEVSLQVNKFIEKVRVLIADSKQMASENSSVAHELSSTSLETGRRVEEATSIVNNTTVQSEQMQEEMHRGIEEAQVRKEGIATARTDLDEANASILNMTEQIQASAAMEIDLARKIDQLSQDAEQVKEVLTIIGDIADQTNLLALNAAIEAARAGEHGRGFAVVADEVRKLAERTQKSLIEINSTINIIVQSVVESSDAMDKNAKRVEELADVARNVEVKIGRTFAVITDATALADETVEGYMRNAQSLEAMVSGISKINILSTENARSVEEMAAAAEHLNKMTESLNNKLSQFKT